MKYLLLALTLLFTSIGSAHEVKQNGEVINYTNWENREGKDCCNNQHCRPLKADEIKLVGDHYEVKVLGRQWCEVFPKHYLKKGANAPMWSVAHACIIEGEESSLGMSGVELCDLLACFQPPAQF